MDIIEVNNLASQKGFKLTRDVKFGKVNYILTKGNMTYTTDNLEEIKKYIETFDNI